MFFVLKTKQSINTALWRERKSLTVRWTAALGWISWISGGQIVAQVCTKRHVCRLFSIRLWCRSLKNLSKLFFLVTVRFYVTAWQTTRKEITVMCHIIFDIFHLIGDNFVLLEALEETSGRPLLRKQSGWWLAVIGKTWFESPTPPAAFKSVLEQDTNTELQVGTLHGTIVFYFVVFSLHCTFNALNIYFH